MSRARKAVTVIDGWAGHRRTLHRLRRDAVERAKKWHDQTHPKDRREAEGYLMLSLDSLNQAERDAKLPRKGKGRCRR